jgi:hypothetical protein
MILGGASRPRFLTFVVPQGNNSMTQENGTIVLPAYLRQRDVAALLSCSVAYLQKLHRLGTGPRRVLLNGTLPVYPVLDLHRWAQEQVEGKAVNG